MVACLFSILTALLITQPIHDDMEILPLNDRIVIVVVERGALDLERLEALVEEALADEDEWEEAEFGPHGFDVWVEGDWGFDDWDDSGCCEIGDEEHGLWHDDEGAYAWGDGFRLWLDDNGLAVWHDDWEALDPRAIWWEEELPFDDVWFECECAPDASRDDAWFDDRAWFEGERWDDDDAWFDDRLWFEGERWDDDEVWFDESTRRLIV